MATKENDAPHAKSRRRQAQPPLRSLKELTIEPKTFTAEGFEVGLADARSGYVLENYPENVQHVTIILNGTFIKYVANQDARLPSPPKSEKEALTHGAAGFVEVPFTCIATLKETLGLTGLRMVTVYFPNGEIVACTELVFAVEISDGATKLRHVDAATTTEVNQGLHAYIVQSCGDAVSYLVQDLEGVDEYGLKVKAVVGEDKDVVWEDIFWHDGRHQGASFGEYPRPKCASEGSWVYVDQ